MEAGIIRMYQRLNDLLLVGNVSAPHIQTQIADVRRDLKASGQTDADIFAHTDPKRFDAPPAGRAVLSNAELAERLVRVESHLGLGVSK